VIPLLAFFVASGSVADAPRRIAFTFDDGPSFRTTPALLETLERWQVKATFFVNGYRFTGSSKPHELNRVVLHMTRDGGHTIGNHTFQHLPLPHLDSEALRDEIVKNEEAIASVIGDRPTLFRPPYGRQSPTSWIVAHQRGYRVVLWDVSPLDHHVRNAERLRDRVMEEIHRSQGGIVILHDTYAWTVAAVELIMQEIARENCRLLAEGEVPYQIVPLEEILEPRANPRGRQEWLAELWPSCSAGTR